MCQIQWPYLEFHHIDEDPSNTVSVNLLPLCPTHHEMATKGYLDKKSCSQIRENLSEFEKFGRGNASTENSMLFALCGEIACNLFILEDERLLGEGGLASRNNEVKFDTLVVPRLRHVVVDQMLAAAGNIGQTDSDLLRLLYDLSLSLHTFNDSIGVTELGLTLGGNKHSQRLHTFNAIRNSPAIEKVCEFLCLVYRYILRYYSDAAGINDQTTFFKNVYPTRVFDAWYGPDRQLSGGWQG